MIEKIEYEVKYNVFEEEEINEDIIYEKDFTPKLVWPNRHLNGYFWPLKDKVPHFAKYIESLIHFTGEDSNILLLEFLNKAESYDLATKKHLCDYFFPLLERNKNNQYFDQKRIFSVKIRSYFRKVLKELQREYPSDYHYYKWYGLFLNYKDSLDKLIIANQLLNNSDDEVLIKIINYKVTRISNNVDQLLYTYLEKDVDRDIRELMETVTMVSCLKSKSDKENLMKVCNDLTTRLTEYKISMYALNK